MINQVLDYWFGDLDGEFADDTHRAMWWSGGETVDAEVRTNFGGLIGAADAGELDDWLATTRGRLAFIIVCDQFSRHVHRGTPAAFATDPLALTAARDGVEAGADRQLRLDERGFFYLPFEHAEDLCDQHTCVNLFTQLRDETPAGQRHLTGAGLRHAHQHRDIIARFGRFPHRNALLGRASTAEEQAYLKTAHTFGQG
jgi:uncharacterized protein (DUF924 family)